MGRKAEKVATDKKIVSPKRLVADIWHVLSYHYISKSPGMVWYGMVWYDMTGVLLLLLLPPLLRLQHLTLTHSLYHQFQHGGWKNWAEDAVEASADPAAVPAMCQAHRLWRPKPPLMQKRKQEQRPSPSPCCSVRNVPCDKRFLRGDNLSISDRIYLSARGRMTSTPTARRERRPCRSRNQVRSEVQPLPCHRMVPWVEFESLGGNNGSPPRDRPRCDAMRCDAMQILAPLFQVVVLAA